MFQRLKGAFDSIADLAEEPPRARPARASSQSKLSSRTLSPRKQTRSRINNDIPDQTPDPDPTTFALDPPTTEEVSVSQSEKGDTPVEASAPEKDNENPDAGARISQDAGVEALPPKVEERPAELSEDVKGKLRRLDKLEGKYQELLKAYRKAHARNAAILPFEASLRETTPLTSINDPGALVEYLSQLSLKSDMVMDEFKRLSGERDNLKRMLEEANQRAKDAFDEVTQLKAKAEEHPEPIGISSTDEEVEVAEAVARPVSSPSNEDSNAPQIVHEPVSLTIADPLGALTSDVSNSNTALSTIETLKLETKMQEQVAAIEQLEKEKATLREELVTATDSATELKQKLVTAEVKLNSLEATLVSRLETETELKTNYQAKEAEITSLKEQLSGAEIDITAKTAAVAQLEEELTAAKASTAQVKNETVSNGDNTVSKPTELASQTPTLGENGEATEGTKKKKNKKKKKKNAGGAGEAATPVSNEGESSAGPLDTKPVSGTTDVTAGLANAVIQNLKDKLKNQDDMLEEIDHLRDELVSLGQEHVDAKEQVTLLRKENLQLKESIEELEKQVEESERKVGIAQEGADGDRQQLLDELSELKVKSSTAESDSLAQVQKLEVLEAKIAEHEAIRTSFENSLAENRRQWSSEAEDYKIKTKSLETDITAAQQLAASRYKDLSHAKETLQKLQPEISLMRNEIAELKNTKAELDNANTRLRKSEAKDSSLQAEITTYRRKIIDSEAEIERLKQETSRQLALEESSRQLQADLQRVSNEKAELSTSREDLAEDLKKFQGESRSLRARLRQLEGQLEDSHKETATLRDDSSARAATYDEAVRNMTSARDQAAELATQMREAKERSESLEEELTDAHRLMNERAREGETMRRLLGEVESRAETRVKEFKERLEILTQERDRAEDEASTTGRKRTREVDDLKNKLRDVERELKQASESKVDVERNERELRRQIEDDGKKVAQAIEELSEVRSAMSELREALDESERQCREMDTEKTSMKRALEESLTRAEKAQKTQQIATDELRSIRATRIRPVGSDAPSTRSSAESTRLTSPISSRQESRIGSIGQAFGAGGVNSIDYVYLKNVLLQFLEQKDKSHQMQLIPVLSMLLHFDKKDEQKWTTAISAK